MLFVGMCFHILSRDIICDYVTEYIVLSVLVPQ